MIKFKGIGIFTKEEQAQIKSLTQFIYDKFFSKRLQNVLEVNMSFHKGLFKNERVYGDCIWEDQHYKPREFTVRVDVDQKFKMVINTIAHELTHVKQWAKGEMFEMQRQRKIYKFNKEEYDTNKMDYWDLPWEIEAHGRAIGLVVQWVDQCCVDGTMKLKETKKLIVQ
jgi:hypothetical protein